MANIYDVYCAAKLVLFTGADPVFFFFFALLYIKSQEAKSGIGNQKNFTRVFPRSDFGKAKISHNFFAEESRPPLS